MTRHVQVAAALCVVAFGVVGQAAAQPSSADRPIAVQVSGGGSFGNSSGGTVAVEGDYSFRPSLAVFAEYAYFTNVAPRFVTDRANVVAAIIGGTAKAKEKAGLFDIGLKYTLRPIAGGYNPYVGLGVGVAKVKTDTTITVGGASLDEAALLTQYGVQLGNDLAGDISKTAVTALFGINRDFARRYALDVSYRYSRILPKAGTGADQIEGDTAINANRLQVGVVIRF